MFIRAESTNSGIRLQPLERWASPKLNRKLKKKKDKKSLKEKGRRKVVNTILIDIEPIFLKRPKDTREEFIVGSSHDEGFSSEDHSYARKEITDNNLNSKIPEEEEEESRIKEDNEAEENFPGYRNDEEEYRTEDDVEDPNYVLYEELESEDDPHSATEESTAKYSSNETILDTVVSRDFLHIVTTPAKLQLQQKK